MIKNIWILFVLLGFLPTLHGQGNSEVLIIDSQSDISLPAESLLKEIVIPLGPYRTKKSLLQQCKDSTRFYEGNCFRVTHYENILVSALQENSVPEDLMRGEIYKLTEEEIEGIRSALKDQKAPKADSLNLAPVMEPNDTAKVVYTANFVFQYGGESKLTILPKVNFLRKHRGYAFKPCYGLELGFHPLLVFSAYTFSAIGGVERGFLSLESSFSHFRTTKIPVDNDSFNGLFSQNAINLKLGFQVYNARLKLGTSFVLNENIPAGQERIEFLDIGLVNGTIFGVELQFKIK